MKWLTIAAVAQPALLVLACAAPSGTGVPALHPENLHEPAFAGLSPKGIALVVEDQRNPLPDTSGEMVDEVTRALTARLRSAGFAVNEAQPNRLRVEVTFKDEPLPGYDRDDCIWFSGKLNTTSGAFVESEGGACFEWRNLYGMGLGGDASTAFETGLTGMLEQLDRGWSKLGAASG